MSVVEMKECRPIDRDAELMDPSGFWFLIRPNFRHGIIEVAVCHRDFCNSMVDGPMKYAKEICYGRSAQDIYHELLLGKPYVTLMTHAAYLGKELKKAEIALALGIKDHYQE